MGRKIEPNLIGEEVSVQKTYGETLLELGHSNPLLYSVEADLMKASGGIPFAEAFPDRHIQVGIAEQNLIGVAAGLAAMGKIPFASTFANFISQRSCDQAVNSVCYNKFNVKICGSYSGLSSEKNGGTHIGVEDIAIFRCMPNMAVIVPGDCVELKSAMKVASEYDGPVYLRIARGPMPTIFPKDYEFKMGESVTLSEGTDISLLTTGITTWEGINAVKSLKARGISVLHIHFPTIKPIDQEEIIRAAKVTGRIVTVENHSRFGGFGGLVSEIVCEHYPVPVFRLGMNDCFGETADLAYLTEKYGINSKHIFNVIEALMKVQSLLN